jgi:CubicO group peptidase (beta-lactamase class C family)
MQMNLVPVEPEKQGFSFESLHRLDLLFQSFIDQDKLAGLSVTVAREGKTVYLNKFGFADKEAGKTLRFDSVFRIASMTKPVTTTAAMMLYEQGFFNLNTPVKEFLPEFADLQVVKSWESGEPITEPMDGELTFRHLFTHTSGLPYGGNDNDPLDQLLRKKYDTLKELNLPFNNQILVEGLSSLPLAFQPGTHWRYGFNIEVLGRIIEVISGETLDSFLAKRIFQPLNMLDTGFFLPESKRERLCALYGHTPESAGLQRLPGDFPTERPSMISGGGGLCSTLPDYARFCQMLVNQGELDGNRILSPKTIELFRLNQAPAQALPYGFRPNDLFHAGYGFSLGTRVLMDVAATGVAGSVGEFGWDGAFNTFFWIDPVEKLYTLVMVQHHPNNFYPIFQRTKSIVYASLLKPGKMGRKQKKLKTKTR